LEILDAFQSDSIVLLDFLAAFGKVINGGDDAVTQSIGRYPLSVVDALWFQQVLQSMEKEQQIFQAVVLFLRFVWFLGVCALLGEGAFRAMLVLFNFDVVPEGF
jgi:hypothetical protein